MDNFNSPFTKPWKNAIILPMNYSINPKGTQLPRKVAAYCHYVHDGDTIWVKIKGEEYKVRMLGVAAPEVANKYKHTAAEDGGEMAKAVLKKMVEGKKVFLRFGEKRRGFYGRLLAYIYTEDDVTKPVNQKLIDLGVASHY